MNAVRLFSLLVYTFGVFAYGAMLALWISEMGRVGWAARRRAITPGREVDTINGALLALSFLWFAALLRPRRKATAARRSHNAGPMSIVI